MVHSHSTNRDEHGSAVDAAVLPQNNWVCSSSEEEGGSHTKSGKREEQKEEKRQALMQVRGCNTIHILGEENFPDPQAQEKGSYCPVIHKAPILFGTLLHCIAQLYSEF